MNADQKISEWKQERMIHTLQKKQNVDVKHRTSSIDRKIEDFTKNLIEYITDISIWIDEFH